ncbi:uncharacterized protein N7484_010686 [Penicillium longicatenatum]|uniref:uncharacterized protein n=1 Tax=Penicillium longicatenatum TaxID=1561947 RepID=UPI0025481196|nr:uncharacterized protein N7484_010686 [Penicillium longicatenatum]KAJ5630586.1 hypothetical protein N7484_010686 [Penicillium longicatenatum]
MSKMWSANTKIRLPYPFLTTFCLVPSHDAQNNEVFQLSKEEGFAGEASLPVELHDDNIQFTRPSVVTSTGLPAITALRQQRPQQGPLSICSWDSTGVITVNHIWLILYTIFTIEPELETFRLQLYGPGSDAISEDLRLSMVALNSDGCSVVFRSSFWQGCASPLSSRSIWTSSANNTVPHLHYVTTSTATIRRSHPLRPPKSTSGSIAYSRYIPSLDKVFSLVIIDHQDPTHVEFFHQSRRTSSPASDLGMQGDSLEEDYEYLRRKNEDAHTIGLLGQFDGTLFGYFEVFWAKEDPLGVASDASDFDRGLNASIGYSSFKSRRWLQACWSSLLHYIFLDEHRTENIIGNGVWGHELLGDASFELLEDEMVQLPHQRIHLTRYSRELFFSLCPFDGALEDVNLQLPSRL